MNWSQLWLQLLLITFLPPQKGPFLSESYSCRFKLSEDKFWKLEKDNDDHIRRRLKFIRKIKIFEQDYREDRQKILRQLRLAKTRLDQKKAHQEKAVFKQTKAKAGYL